MWNKLVVPAVGRELLCDLVSGPLESESVCLDRAVNRVAASDVISDCGVPGCDRSRVDGYGVRSRDTYGASESVPAYLTVVGSAVMGQETTVHVGIGDAVTVPTGGMLPPGADAVVMIEHVSVSSDSLSVLKPVAAGENVVRRGEDTDVGDVVIGKGSRLRPAGIGALASVGATAVDVFCRPRASVLSTGDEVVPPECEPGPARVRDVNGPALAAALNRDGCAATYDGVIDDEQQTLTEAIAAAVKQADVVLVSGGSSVGAKDFTARAIHKLGPPGVLVHGLIMKPGKPTIIGAVGRVPVIGLPGHPVAALTVYEVVLKSMIGKLCGMTISCGLHVRARLGTNVGSAVGREEYIRVSLKMHDGELWADIVPGNSSLIAGLARAHGLAVIPAAASGIDRGQLAAVLIDPYCEVSTDE